MIQTNNLQEALAGLNATEQSVLINIARLFLEYDYREVTNHDLHTDITTHGHEQVFASLTSLHNKHLIEMYGDEAYATVTGIPFIHDLSESEIQILSVIIALLHSNMQVIHTQVVDTTDILFNVSNIQENAIPQLLLGMAQKGLITLNEENFVISVFAGNGQESKGITTSQQQFTIYHAKDTFAMIAPNGSHWLHERELHYTHVATVATPLNTIFSLTNNHDDKGAWMSNPEVIWYATDARIRSTSVGDVIFWHLGIQWG